MTDDQWQVLLNVIDGEVLRPPPVGFIIDSPWLPGWAGVSTLEYYTDGELWFEANLKALRAFPEIMFFPGFWSEFGMCSEPSAFGARCIWHEHELPFAAQVIPDYDAIAAVQQPNPRTDGLCPFILARLKQYEQRIRQHGHQIRFAVARGPLNIASFLLGNTQFLRGINRRPDDVQTLLQTITSFLANWLELQATTFPSIDGLLILDDLIGFLGPRDFEQFALPHLQRLFQAVDVSVKFLHNDAHGLVTARYLREAGVNLFNFSFEHRLDEIKKLTDNSVTLLGNLPPRDVLAQGSPADVRAGVQAVLDSVADKSRVIFSCGGGMPPNVSTQNIRAFSSAVQAVAP